MRKLMKQFATGGVPAMPNGMPANAARPSKGSRKKHKRR
jgi:hypothetical protein